MDSNDVHGNLDFDVPLDHGMISFLFQFSYILIFCHLWL